MAIEGKPGQTLRVTISKTITREGARKTLERLFMGDKVFRKPIDDRSKNFKHLPKRRGGVIWTKRPDKVHPPLLTGHAANVLATAQSLKDLNSVADFVKVG